MGNSVLNALRIHINNERLVIQNTQHVRQYKHQLDQIDKDLYDFLMLWFGEVPTITMQTSGSTGIPKQIIHTKSAMRTSAENTLQYFKLQKGDTALLCLPVRFVAGKMMVVRALIGELELYAVEPTSLPVTDLQVPIKFAAMTPHQVAKTLNISTSQLNLIEILIIGGGEVSSDLIDTLNSSTVKTKCYSTFGMTETITHIAVKALNPPSSFYSTLPGINVFLTPQETLGVDIPYIQKEPIITNDIVKINEKNAFQWLGRLDNVINSGGVKLFPEAIENKIAHLFKGLDFYITSEADQLLGEQLVLMVEASDTFVLPDLASVLTKLERPKKLVVVKEFERTSTGKILRKKL
jgi:o-succinylbenzoate---CoA ligase